MSPAPRSVLIVEDSPVLLDTLKELLELDGFVVHTATNGRFALELLLHGLRPGVIVTDLVMPEMDGVALCLACKRQHELAAIPRIIVSVAADTPALLPEIPSCEAFGVLMKPFEQEELVDLMTRAMAAA